MKAVQVLPLVDMELAGTTTISSLLERVYLLCFLPVSLIAMVVCGSNVASYIATV